MSKPLAFSSLKAMQPKEREDRLARVVVDARRAPNGEIKSISDRLSAYERQFGFSSTEMRERVSGGSLAESDDVCSWLMLLDLQARVVARTR